jgi:hypothetical protein
VLQAFCVPAKCGLIELIGTAIRAVPRSTQQYNQARIKSTLSYTQDAMNLRSKEY